MIKSSKKKIIIDGGEGFLGRSILKFLNKLENFDLIKLDRNLEYSPLENESYILIIATGSFKASAFELANSNIMRPLRVLSKYEENISKVILLSSGAVYGSKLNNDRSKEEDTLVHYDIYSSTKIAIENLISLFCSNTNLPLSILRLPVVYASDHMKGVLPSMLKSYSEENFIQVYGEGKAIRDFLHISDFLDAMLNIIKLDIRGIYNISSEVTYSMAELASIIAKNESEIKFLQDDNNLLEQLVE